MPLTFEHVSSLHRTEQNNWGTLCGIPRNLFHLVDCRGEALLRCHGALTRPLIWPKEQQA